MTDELKTIWYETVRPNCGTILASAYSKDSKPLASTETSAHTCNFHTDVQANLSTCIEFLKHKKKKILNSENSHSCHMQTTETQTDSELISILRIPQNDTLKQVSKRNGT